MSEYSKYINKSTHIRCLVYVMIEMWTISVKIDTANLKTLCYFNMVIFCCCICLNIYDPCMMNEMADFTLSFTHTQTHTDTHTPCITHLVTMDVKKISDRRCSVND